MIMILKLQDLFDRDLEIIYDCERQLVKDFPKIIDAVSSVPLRNAFTNDLTQATTHAERLNHIFAILKRLPAEEPDHALKAIFRESEKLIKDIDRSALLDSALIIFGSQVHHHKIALYRSLWSLAQGLGFNEAVDPLKRAMTEERAADDALTEIGVQSVIPEAVHVMNPPHGWVII
jgi:ferritin-like metal-binding protein YciE